jgi:HD-GYP domain-containing protein (c-di-GMP phosphodiesterase class II)
MDPVAEQLHRMHQEQSRSAPTRREQLADLTSAFALGIACFTIGLVHGVEAPSPLTLALFVALFAGFWQVSFQTGAAATTPVQLLLVPMWFAFSPALIPLVVAAGQVLGNVIASARGREHHHWGRVLIGIPDAWYAVGPALVLAAFGADVPTVDDAWIYVLALGAQFATDGISGMARVAAASGVHPRDQVRSMGWIWAVDTMLTPIGLTVALASASTPILVVALVPLAWLFGQFARERDDRIQSALQLSHAYRGTAQLMGDVLEADDAYTGGEHTRGVVAMALDLGRALQLDHTSLRSLEFGALLHDIGKLRVPNEIINKPGKLTAEEWAIIKQHPAFGQEMLDRVGGELGRAAIIVRAHHERWDGGGYPDGLAGEEIPIEARIITVCDSFSAMTTDRSYRRGMSVPQALGELERCSGTQFDPDIIRVARTMFGDVPAQQTLRAVGTDPTPALGAPEPARDAA